MNILLTSTCGKVTAPQELTLTYDVAIHTNSKLYIRLNRNTAGGLFSNEWLEYEAIKKALKEAIEPFCSTILKPLFTTASANNTGYLIAVLRQENIVEGHEDKVRKSVIAKPLEFEKRMAKLAKAAKYLPDTLPTIKNQIPSDKGH